jgi:endo-1,4-beta-mannosidase
VAADVAGDGERFSVGINYWPARTAMGWWSAFDAKEVMRDFRRIATNGFDSVRFFLLWEAFQPEPSRVDHETLGRLVTVADAAASAGLRIVPTLFTGHMSGVDWVPGWALVGTERDARFRVVSSGRVVDDGLRDWYADVDVARAQALFATEAAATLAGHEALWAWDLGNENSNCVVPPDRDAGRRWLEQMSAAIRDADPGAAVTIGIHAEDLEQDRNLGPREAAEVCDFLTMHGYPIYASWARGATDAEVVPFLAELTRTLGGGVDVLFSEFGLPTAALGTDPEPPLVGERDAADYIDGVLQGLHRVGAIGGMLWCFSDYDPAIWAHPPLDEATHERSFGLWRADGSPKPAVDRVAAFTNSEPPIRSDRPPMIDVDQARYWRAPETELPRLYAEYLGS